VVRHIVGALQDYGYVSEPGELSPHHVVQKPRKPTNAQVSDFTMMVKVPGRPQVIRVFTATEDAEAHQYANDTGGSVVPLPLPPPDGYIVGSNGHLVPESTVPRAGTAAACGPTDIAQD
jgi:hypothetical protein